MKVARIATQRGAALALVDEDGVHDLALIANLRDLPWAETLLSNWQSFLLSGDRGLDLARRLREFTPLQPATQAQTRFLAPFEGPSKIIAHVVNYWEHGAESNLQPPEHPFFFYKPASSVAHPGEALIAHTASSKMDHEVELAAVIGRVCRDVPEEQADSMIAGYTVLNDVSYRDLQMIEDTPSMAKRYGKNWTQGKGLDHACPVGPWVVMADEMPSPYPLKIECRVNGEVRQRSSTGKMIYNLAKQIAHISNGMTLYPGDIITTGTCEGGGTATGKWLRPGDLVECEIEQIGVLSNPVAAGKDFLSLRPSRSPSTTRIQHDTPA